MTIFGAGLLLLAAAAILAAIAVWRSNVLPRASAILFATGMALFLPQFFGPAAVRIAHGILLAAGLIILAAALWASASRPRGWVPSHAADTGGRTVGGWGGGARPAGRCP